MERRTSQQTDEKPIPTTSHGVRTEFVNDADDAKPSYSSARTIDRSNIHSSTDHVSASLGVKKGNYFLTLENERRNAYSKKANTIGTASPSHEYAKSYVEQQNLRTNDSSRTPLHRTVSLDSDRQEDGSKAPFRTPSPNISSSNGSKQKFASPRRLHYSSSFHVNPYSDQQPNYSQSYIERPDLSRNLDSPKTPGSKTPELSSYSERVDRHRTNLPARSYSERGFSDRIEPRRNLPPQNLSQRFDSLLSNSHNVFSSSIDRRSEASRRFNPSSVRQQSDPSSNEPISASVSQRFDDVLRDWEKFLEEQDDMVPPEHTEIPTEQPHVIHTPPVHQQHITRQEGFEVREHSNEPNVQTVDGPQVEQTDQTSLKEEEGQSTQSVKKAEEPPLSDSPSNSKRSAVSSSPTKTWRMDRRDSDPGISIANVGVMEPSLEDERRNQLERKKKKKSNPKQQKKKKKKKESPKATQDGPTLETLVSQSVCPDLIFEKLAEPNTLREQTDPLLGIKVLLKLHPDQQQQYHTLVHYPSLIVETLIMNEYIDDVQNILREYEELRENELLKKYAIKALTIPKLPPHLLRGKTCPEWREQCEFTGVPISGDKLILSQDKSFLIIWDYRGKWNKQLTGNDFKDDDLRKSHFFSGGTPNSGLAIALLDVTPSRKIGQNCIDVCDQLSEDISNSIKEDRILGIKIMEELLLHAKKTFLLSSTNTPKVALCDSYLRDIDVLKGIAQSSSGTQPSLLELTDKRKIRKLRDTLMSENLIELAFSVSTKYNIECEPVWAAWGFSLLKESKFDEAREKFKYCLTSSRQTKMSIPVILQDIIATLEMLPPGSTYTRKDGVTSKLFTQDSEAARFDQCIYYLTEYGTPQLLIKFMLKHNKLKELCRYVFIKALPRTLFVDNIVAYCAERPELHKDLQDAIGAMDSKQRKDAREYILAACNYFNKKNRLDDLLKWQELMEDHPRAGLTCIRIFVERQSLDVLERNKYLERAKGHFLEELQLMHEGVSENVLTNADIHKYLKKVTLQQEISIYFVESKIDSSHLKTHTLFGPLKQRSDLAEFLLTCGNNDLGIGVILNFQLSVIPILTNVFDILFKKGQHKEIIQLLQRSKDLLLYDDNSWDQFIQGCIKRYVAADQAKVGGKLVPFIIKDENKIDSLILCEKLKTAYLLAVKLNQRDKVALIRDEAKSKNFMTEYRLCVQYLSLSDTTQPSNDI